MPKNFDFVANAGQQVGAGAKSFIDETRQAAVRSILPSSSRMSISSSSNQPRISTNR